MPQVENLEQGGASESIVAVQARSGSLGIFGRLAIGGGMTVAAMAGSAAVIDGVANFNHPQIELSTNNAQPSNALSADFELLEDIGAGLGLYFVGKRGLSMIRRAVDPKDDALKDLSKSNTKPGARSRYLPFIAGASLIASGAAVMSGNFFDTANGVSSSETNVASLLQGLHLPGPENGTNFFITNSPIPALANSTSISQSITSEIVSSATGVGLVAEPVRWEWHSTYRPNRTAAIETLAISLPTAGASNQEGVAVNCDDAPVAASEALGVPIGGSIIMDGLKLKVASLIEGHTGADLVPVIFSNEEFAKCLDGNPNQPYNGILVNGTEQQVRGLLNQDGSTRPLFSVALKDFLENTQQYGENNVDPLVLEVIFLSLLFAGAALGNKTRNAMASSSKDINMFRASGFDEHMINRIFVNKIESEILQSTAIAVPLIALVDAFTNSGEPGATFGPDTKSLLAVAGLMWVAGRLSTSLAIRRQIKADSGEEL